MSRVVWTEHRPKLEISNRPASWTDQLDHGRFTNEDGCRHHQRNLKVEAPHFHPQEIDGNVPVQSVPISTPKTLTPQGLLLKRWKTNHFLCPKRPENVENVEDVCPASELLLEPIASWHETAWGRGPGDKTNDENLWNDGNLWKLYITSIDMATRYIMI